MPTRRTKSSKGRQFIKEWAKAVKKAKKQLDKEGYDISGFVPVGGKTKIGKLLLRRVRQIMKKNKKNKKQ